MHAVEAYGEAEISLHLFCTLGTIFSCVVSCVPWLLYQQGKCCLYLLNRRLRRFQSQYGLFQP